MFKRVSFAVLAAALAVPVLADNVDSQMETATVMTVEHGSHRKPPFKRRFESMPVTDVAAMDAAEPVETVMVKTVRMGANRKPPFKREMVELPVTDIAVMEAEERGSSVDFRGHPPFNRHRR